MGTKIMEQSFLFYSDPGISSYFLGSMPTFHIYVDILPSSYIILGVVSTGKGRCIEFNHLELSPPNSQTRRAHLRKYKTKL